MIRRAKPPEGPPPFSEVPEDPKGVSKKEEDPIPSGVFQRSVTASQSGATAAKGPVGEERHVCISPQVSIPTEDKDEFIKLFSEFFAESSESENAAPRASAQVPLSDRVNTLSLKFLSQERRTANIKPRIEDRGIEGDVFQLALALNNGEERTRFNAFLHQRAPELCKKYAVIQAGSTTLEIGIKGIDKASPMRYLATEQGLTTALGSIGYNPGSGLLQPGSSGSMIAADFDGTLVDPPKKGESPRNQNIGNSAAGKDIIAYLKAGGILLVNSGNDISRVISRIKGHVPKELLGNILVAASGGNTLWGFDKDGNESEITAFRETALSIPTSEEHRFNCIYLGDDKRPKGNDRAGFEFADKEHSMCVGTDMHLEPAAHEFLDEEHIIRGGPEASAHIFREVLEAAKTAEPTDPLFTSERVALIREKARASREKEISEVSEALSPVIEGVKAKETHSPSIRAEITKAFDKITRFKRPDGAESYSWEEIQDLAAGEPLLREALQKFA